MAADGALMNDVMYRVGSQMFARQGLRVRRNLSGFLIYAFMYSLACNRSRRRRNLRAARVRG